MRGDKNAHAQTRLRMRTNLDFRMTSYINTTIYDDMDEKHGSLHHWNGQMEGPHSKGYLKWTDGRPSQQRSF